MRDNNVHFNSEKQNLRECEDCLAQKQCDLVSEARKFVDHIKDNFFGINPEVILNCDRYIGWDKDKK